MDLEQVKALGALLKDNPLAIFLALSVLANAAQWIALQRSHKAHLKTTTASVQIATQLTKMIQTAARAAKEHQRQEPEPEEPDAPTQLKGRR